MSKRTQPLLPHIGMRQSQLSPFKNVSAQQKAGWYNFKNVSSDTAELYIYDEIGGWWGTDATDFVNELRDISAKNLNVHINSPGGDVFDSVAIYNALSQYDGQVNIIVDALAASGASVIAMAGDTITMLGGSMMMIHDGIGMTYGNAGEHRSTADLLDKVSNNIAAVYADRAGGAMEEWRAVMQLEQWYTADEAVSAGLADKVDKKQATDNPENHWNLSIFNYAGRNAAPDPATVRKTAILNVAKGVKTVSAPKDDNAKATETTEPAQVEEQNAGATGDGQHVPGTAPAPVQPVENKAGSFVLMCDGKAVTDVAAVQAHINTLENREKENRESNIKAFVQKLADDGKILATGVEDLQKFALGLQPEQYTTWASTWNVVPQMPLFARHGNGSTNHDGTPSGRPVDALQQEIADKQAVVRRHLQGNMQRSTLEQTTSWKFLVAHDALPEGV